MPRILHVTPSAASSIDAPIQDAIENSLQDGRLPGKAK
jgi:hypothetical protein